MTCHRLSIRALRSHALIVALLGTAALWPAGTSAQADYPNKPFMLVTAFAPGSGPDATLRMVADKLGKLWVRNKVNTDMAKVLADPEVKARFDTFAFEPISGSADEITRAAEVKSKVYEQLVKKANISLE